MAVDNPPPKDNRLLPLDLLRGTLIILMTLDHANYHIAQQHSPGEYWGGYYPLYPSPLHFLTRFVTHFSAPGFFFLLGVGMVLFSSSRTKKGWKEIEIRRHFLLRGLVLIALQGFLNYSQAWSVGGSPAPVLYVGVLVALGFGMILCIPLLDLKPVWLAGIGLGFLVIMEILTPAPELWGRNFDNLAGTLLVYSGGKGEFWTNYPLLAWVELIILGLIFGKWVQVDSKKAYQRGAWLGLAFLLTFVVLRTINGFGTIRLLNFDSWMEFFYLVKYPPSMAFVMLTMGVNLILLAVFSLIKQPGSRDWNPVLIYGRAALFSYLVHIGIYALLGRLLTPQGSSLGVMYALWVAGLVILYYPALWYGKYKAGQPLRSWMRFF